MMVQGEFFKFNVSFSMFNDEILIRIMTELWEMETIERRLIAPTLTNGDYGWGDGLFLVDIGYCRKI